jgi:sortase A
MAAIVSVICFLVAASVAVYPAVTDAWAAHAQERLRDSRFIPLDEARPGDLVMRVEVPAIELDALVVEGTDTDDLRAGIGHYRDTAGPGQSGNVALAGHRTTYGKPFEHIDELESGDRIHMRSSGGEFVYEVIREPWVVSPTDWSAIEDVPSSGSFLTLTSCHPEGSASTRIVARARLVRELSR